MSADHASGSVHTLTGGQNELSTFLGAAAQRNQLVLVDFSTSWCGPCRMMVPVLAALAAEHRGRLVVIKVDCEQTQANQALAASAGIRAFPTFHLYRGTQRVGEQRGADQAALRRLVSAQLAQLGPAGGGSGAGAAVALCNAVAQALARVKAGCTYDEFVAAAKTLLTFVGNVIDHGGEERYRRVKASNPAYHNKLGCRPGGKQAMTAIGFREMMEAGEAVLVMTDVPPELPRVRQLLQSALQQAEAAQQRAMAGATAPPAAAAPAPAAASGASAAPAAGPAAAGSAAATAPVDATALARALAAATSLGGRGAGSTAAGGRGAGPAGPGRRSVVVTPAKLARVLAKAMEASGIGVPLPQGSDGGAQQQQPPAP